jgi:LDH2 family malate/lactate/ureidoglycolate dehydrogenase
VPSAKAETVIDIGRSELATLCTTGIAAAGDDEQTTAALTDAVVAAERRGKASVGVAHLSTISTPFVMGASTVPPAEDLGWRLLVQSTAITDRRHREAAGR